MKKSYIFTLIGSLGIFPSPVEAFKDHLNGVGFPNKSRRSQPLSVHKPRGQKGWRKRSSSKLFKNYLKGLGKFTEAKNLEKSSLKYDKSSELNEGNTSKNRREGRRAGLLTHKLRSRLLEQMKKKSSSTGISKLEGLSGQSPRSIMDLYRGDKEGIWKILRHHEAQENFSDIFFLSLPLYKSYQLKTEPDPLNPSKAAQGKKVVPEPEKINLQEPKVARESITVGSFALGREDLRDFSLKEVKDQVKRFVQSNVNVLRGQNLEADLFDYLADNLKASKDDNTMANEHYLKSIKDGLMSKFQVNVPKGRSPLQVLINVVKEEQKDEKEQVVQIKVSVRR